MDFVASFGDEAQPGFHAARRVLTISVGLVVAVIAIATVNAFTVEWPFFNVSTDFNLAVLLSGALFGLAAYACYRLYVVSDQRIWLALAVAGFLLFLETFLAIHERLEAIEALEKPLFVAYPVIGLVILVLAARPIMRLPAPGSGLVIAAAAFLVISQVAGGVDSLAPDLWTPLFDLVVVIEEGCEMLSGCFLLAAAAAGLEQVKTTRPAPEAGAGDDPRQFAQR